MTNTNEQPDPPELSEPMGDVLAGTQSGAAHARLPGLLSSPFVVEPQREPLDWPLVADELTAALPAEILSEHDWLPPAKLVEIAVHECPGALLSLSPDALDVVRASRLADILAQATWKNGKGRVVDGQRLMALWESEPARDITFTDEHDAAVIEFAESVERIEQSPLEVARSMVAEPERYLEEDDND